MKSRTNSTATLEHQEGIESLNQWLREQTQSNKSKTAAKKQGNSIVETVFDNTNLKTQTHTQLWIECQPTEECKNLLVAAEKYGEPRTSRTISVSVDSFMMDHLDEIDQTSSGETLLKEIMQEASSKQIWEVLFFLQKV